MEIVFLDSESYGDDIDLTSFINLGKVKFYPETVREKVKSRILNADIIIINNTIVSNDDLKSAHNLKLIAIAATGMNNVDLDYCKNSGIQVKNVTEYATKSVAQHTFALLFHLLEQTSYYDSFVKSGIWSKSGNPTHIGRKFIQLSGKRWGIIGMGTIGQEVSTIAAAFGCEIVYYKRQGSKPHPGVEGISLAELFRSCTIISIHAPLTDNTRNMITKKELALMKTGSILLNLGRGSIINEKDLADSIKGKGIFAGLDVFEHEPVEEKSPLLSPEIANHLVLTPHIGFAAKEAREAVIEGTLKNIKDFLNSK